jgi:putative ABC transport system permease protein
MLTRLILRNLKRRPLRTTLTSLTVAVAIAVFASLLAIDSGVRRMIDTTGDDTVIITFERYKACPPFSRLPVHYADQIAGLDGVRDVMPIRFLLSSCSTVTDLVAIHGVDPAKLRSFRDLEVSADDFAAFAGERGGALVGRAAAARYRWQLGQTVTLPELRGISFVVRGIFAAPGSSLESVILVDREFLEYAIDEVGVITMVAVQVDSPDQIDDVSRRIDALFASSSAQTRSGPEKDFIAGNVADFAHLVRFAQVVAYLALVLVLVAVANSISMSVRERLRELALLRTRGFTPDLATRLICLESVALAAGASLVGVGAAAWVLFSGRLAISVEGFTITPYLSLTIVLGALTAGTLLGLLGALWPARQAMRQPIVAALREVA